MRKKNYKGRCERRTIDKAEGVCRFYSKIQSVYADKLVENEQVVEIHCNVLLEGLDTEAYTTDFLCKKGWFVHDKGMCGAEIYYKAKDGKTA